ncbi:MAG: SIMPL domain-containing protein [Pseudohongiellaceae bacterium]
MPITSPSRCYQFPLLVMLLAISAFADAQNSFDLDVLNPGEIMVNLNVSEQTQVEQDTLHAGLYFAAQGRDRIALQDEVNSKMADALEVLEGSEVDYSIQQYRVFQIQPGRPTRGDGENPLWRAQQGVQLSSQDSAAVLDLVAELQSLGLTMGGLNYSLSPERHEEVADSLMAAALAKLRDRAAAAAAALGKGDMEIVEVTMDTGNNNGFFRGATTAMSMEAMDMAAPVADPGLTTVTFTVSARAILVP